MKTKTNNWEPEYRYETLKGKFTDYRGQERDFTMVAVSIPIKDDSIKVQRPVEVTKGWCYNEVSEVAKMLSIGVSVRCMRDKDLGLGEQIAYGKAVKLQNHTLFVSHPGMINTKMVKALLEQEATFFIKDPGSYIKGYNFDKQRYLTTGKVAEAEMTADELKAARFANNQPQNAAFVDKTNVK